MTSAQDPIFTQRPSIQPDDEHLAHPDDDLIELSGQPAKTPHHNHTTTQRPTHTNNTNVNYTQRIKRSALPEPFSVFNDECNQDFCTRNIDEILKRLERLRTLYQFPLDSTHPVIQQLMEQLRYWLSVEHTLKANMYSRLNNKPKQRVDVN